MPIIEEDNPKYKYKHSECFDSSNLIESLVLSNSNLQQPYAPLRLENQNEEELSDEKDDKDEKMQKNIKHF